MYNNSNDAKFGSSDNGRNRDYHSSMESYGKTMTGSRKSFTSIGIAKNPIFPSIFKRTSINHRSNNNSPKNQTNYPLTTLSLTPRLSKNK